MPAVDDRELVAALRSGDADALSTFHDAYAARLFDYAFAVLRDREAAEDAVHDAILVAIGRIDRLRETDRVTVWLYALTRNEVVRQTRRSRMASRPKLPDSRDQTIFFGADLQTEQARAWIRDAAAGLVPHRREALDLTVRHGLSDSDLATVLGMSGKRAARRVAAARADLDRALDSLLAARAGRGACPALDELLTGWDGLFTQSVHERVSAHTAGCKACAAGASTRDGAADWYAELPPTPVPSLLRNRLLTTAQVPDRVAYRGEIAEPFLRNGFPIPLHGSRGRRRALLWAAAVALALLLVGGLWYTLRTEVAPRANRSDPLPPTDVVERSPRPTPTGGSVSASAAPSRSASPSPSPSPSASPSPQPSPTRSSSAQPVDPDTKVDAVLADATIGCPDEWRATATSYVRGNQAEEVTLYWGAASPPSKPVRLTRMSEGLYQAQVAGMPMDVPVFWRVVAVTDDGTSETDVRSTERRRQC